MAGSPLIGIKGTAEEVFEQITKTGVSKADAAVIVGSWIFENFGRAPRVFSYRTDFPATDPDCTRQFVRTFVHQDWVDGEDVVQAEQTTGEEGFNLRFHRIESDLDALARDVATAFVCLAAQRASLRQLLDEIRNELNTINRTVAEPRERPPFAFEGAGRVGTYRGATRFFGKDVNVFETEAGIVMLPAITGVKIDPTDNPRVQRVGELGKLMVEDRVTEFFATEGTVTRDSFIAKFGDEELEGGLKVRDVVDILPSNARFNSPDAMLEGVAAREGAAIRTSPVEGESITAVLGVEGDAKVADVPVDRMEAIPSTGRTALVGAGITKLGQLAGRDAASVSAELKNRGVDVTAREAAGWIATAKTLVNVR
jgi:hypothetical protein